VSVAEPDYQRRTGDAQRVLRGEAPPQVELDWRPGVALALDGNLLCCPTCGKDTVNLDMGTTIPWGKPDVVISLLSCRGCKAEFSVNIERDRGGVKLTTTVRRR